MQTKTRNKFISLGFPTDLISKINSKSLTVSGLAGMSKAALIQMGFTSDEADTIVRKVNRESIPVKTVENILLKTGGVCCYCTDGNNTRPFQIHHIEEYHVGQNNEEENLLLVCPTHHTTIHKFNIPQAEQKSVRWKWEQVWKIAMEYKIKGLDFPFETFTAVDYDLPGSITEIFQYTAPKPSVCAKVIQAEIVNDALKMLEVENRLIISGPSGSGKSTLAYSIIGNMPTFLKYQCSIGSDANKVVKEIYTFLSTAVKPLVLLIDDANTFLATHHLETILKAATNGNRIIIVNTDALKGFEKIEVHFSSSVFYVNWELIKGSVKTTIIDHGDEILPYLKTKRKGYFNGLPIGHGKMDYSLRWIVEQYAKEANSVWQFIYQLGSGYDELDRKHVSLVNNGRLDVVVAYIAINQIAKVEQGTTIDELIYLYKWHSALNGKIEPEEKWLKERLEELVNRRILQIDRGRYNTIHRYFAAEFIEISYTKSSDATVETLNSIFRDFSRIEEIRILWSWFENLSVYRYVQDWYRSFSMQDWIALVSAAEKNGIRMLASIAYRMFSIAVTGFTPIEEAFKGKGKDLAIMLNNAGEKMLPSLKDLLYALKQNSKNVLIEMFANLDPGEFAKTIKQSQAEHFEHINWLLSSVYEIDVKWLDRVCSKITNPEIYSIANTIEKGDIDSLLHIIKFHRTFISNLKRSEYRQYVQLFGELLRGCGLKDMRYSTYENPLADLILFENDVKYLLDCLDQEKLAKDLSRTSPRHWETLTQISLVTRYTNSSVIAELLNKVELSQFQRNVEKYKYYTHELRVLIYQLCYAFDERRKEFSQLLYPIVMDSLKDIEGSDNDDILLAYCTLDYEKGKTIAEKCNKPMPLVKDFNIEEETLIEYRKEIQAKEETGEDYIVAETRFKVH